MFSPSQESIGRVRVWKSQSQLIATAPVQAEVPRLQRLIVFAAFKRGDDGEISPAFEAREMPSERVAVQQAKVAAALYAGAIAWYRDGDVVNGDFDDAVILFERGDVLKPVSE